VAREKVELWRFVLLAPDHPDGYVDFNYALVESISEEARDGDEQIWSIMLSHRGTDSAQEISKAQ
jgi:hypothetical protein